MNRTSVSSIKNLQIQPVSGRSHLLIYGDDKLLTHRFYTVEGPYSVHLAIHHKTIVVM